jgi:hypothetical protein
MKNEREREFIEKVSNYTNEILKTIFVFAYIILHRNIKLH